MQRITLLGATGSIGASTLDVIARHSDRYRLFAASAFNKRERLREICVKFQPRYAVMVDASAATLLRAELSALHCKTEVLSGAQSLVDIATSSECDTVMAAIVGAAGLLPSLAAAKAGKKILLANKEALVMSGALFLDAVRDSNATLLPIDSEHNAIFQCLPNAARPTTPQQQGVEKIVLTASGGPFLRRPMSEFATITPDQACAHPTWSMGRKISVDSATLMNKGLEVIEASLLFNATPTQIEVVIHPQSIVHSLVRYIDGSVLAQLGNPDMRTPIAHAMAYPERISSGVAPLDLTQIASLQFHAVEQQRFPCLQFAFDALRHGGSASAVLNAANEIAVAAFLNTELSYASIAEAISFTLDRCAMPVACSLDHLLEIDADARRIATQFVMERRG